MSKDLNQLWERARRLALDFNENTPNSTEFQALVEEFRALTLESDAVLQKIGRLATIFEGSWNERQWLNLIVPLERYLDRRLSDPEILGALPDHGADAVQKLPLFIIADHWRSAFNVGALFRLADGFGVSRIYLTGYTPTPEQSTVQKTAMGSCSSTPWEHWNQTLELIEHLHSQNIPVWALETNSSAQTLSEVPLPPAMAIILGNERFGLDGKILDACDGHLRIPLRGIKNSMNVANCAGIFAYEWCRQHA